MMGHLDELARDTAQLQILGPNPSAQWAWLKSAAQREAALEEAAGAKGALDAAASFISTADDMLGHFTGSLATPVNSRLAQAGASTRALVTSAGLGSAVLSDIPTAPVFGAYARAFAGLSKTGDMVRLAELLNPADGSARQMARRAGFVIETATDGMIRATQDNLRLLTVGERVDGGMNAFARRLPVAVMRLQGMTAWDASRKRSFQLEFLGALHDRRGQTIADLKAGSAEDKAFARWLEARGFTESDWATIRTAPVWEPRPGAQFLRPLDVPDTDLALRLGEAIDLETRMAVPQTSLWTRAKLLGRTRPGTVWGEAVRFWAQFRSFSLTATHLWAEEFSLRGQAGGMAPGLATAAGIAPFVAFLTIGGAIALQMREMSKGNDPKPMDDAAFWGQALLQGGGLGVMGDAFYALSKRQGKNADANAFGPTGQAVADVYDLTGGNALEIADGLNKGETLGEAAENARIGRDATNIGRRWVPGSSLWWARAAWSRAVMDNLQRLLDPEAEEDFAKQRRRMERGGRGQWWAPGETTPERAPNVANAMGRVD